jgi:1-acyl-sn-glycerol-3-phosphate acyltransferase
VNTLRRRLAKSFPYAPFPFHAGISSRLAWLRAPLRGFRLMLHLLAGMFLVSLVSLDFRGWLQRERLTRWWNRELLNLLHVRVSVRGTPPRSPHLLVCNHISWLDISVVAACELTRFVSKAEVHEWPVAGWLADAAGTFYIRRGAGGTKQITRDMAGHLKKGSVTLFPEGTTTDGSGMLRFQPRLFAAAIEGGAPVQPIALRYGRAANGENIAPYIGDDRLIDNLRRLLREPELRVELIYCEPIKPQAGQDRASLAAAAHAAVCSIVAPGSLPAPATDADESLAA